MISKSVGKKWNIYDTASNECHVAFTSRQMFSGILQAQVLSDKTSHVTFTL